MSRALWFAAGAGASIYAMVRARRVQEALTSEGLRDRWQALGVGARMLRDEVAQGRADAEPALRERLLPAYDPTPQLEAPAESTASSETPELSTHREEGSH